MTLTEFNQLSKAECNTKLMQCCTSERWVECLVACRPFADFQQLFAKADECWQDLAEADYLQAFDGHPKIGDVNSLKAKYANTKQLASGEQSGVDDASNEVIEQLAVANDEYFARFGFIFIVCATGKSAEQMLALLRARLSNDRATELMIAAKEQHKIFVIRLNNLLEGV